jgi:hypothetical protein
MVLSASPWLVKRGCHFTAGAFKADFEPVNARTNSVGLTNKPTTPIQEP